jgi:selenocysteine-specific elongation factor
MRVVGTAGHVDHGKSTLVNALTGINPDRLKEEQEREMTIDLGFAWLTLPEGESVGIIDVPGHRDFIDNMLAGVGGIDAALFVVAADEGVMPQTREHLAILDLLEIERAVIAITKVDLVDDPTWLNLVHEEIEALLMPTALAESPMIDVSALTGLGIEELSRVLEHTLQDLPVRSNLGKPRLSIDRVFTISGFGTVTTGTLLDGSLDVGEDVVALPSGSKGRIRGLQTHRNVIDHAEPGSRVAVNLSGVDVDDLERGDVLMYQGTYEPTRLLDVSFRLISDAESIVKHNQEGKLFLGAAQRMARIRLLGREELHPGESGWLQLVLDRPVVATRGDHFILRRPSPSTTLGGGRIVDPHPLRLHRRWDEANLDRLEEMLIGSPGQILARSMQNLKMMPIGELGRISGLDEDALKAAIEELQAEDILIAFGDMEASDRDKTMVMHVATWENMKAELRSATMDYHTEYPLRVGIPKEELRSKLDMGAKDFNLILNFAIKNEVISTSGAHVRLNTYSIEITPKQEKLVELLLERFKTSPQTPPSVKESIELVGDELLGYCLATGSLLQISNEVLFDKATYEHMKNWIILRLETSGTITVAEARDGLHSTRKYILALMEYLDAEGITKRNGDYRTLA